MTQRNMRIDNIRFVLILLVVFGHLLEPLSGDAIDVIYKTIYTFHMPAFVFVTGWFARFSKKRIVHTALTYLVFETLYRLFQWAVLLPDKSPFPEGYIVAFWSMWFMLALTLWLLCVPLLRARTPAAMLRDIVISVAIALIVGFIPAIGYVLSLSRVCVFAPFFIAGFYVRKLLAQPQDINHPWRQWIHANKQRIHIACTLGAIATPVVTLLPHVTKQLLYGSLCYAASNSTVYLRLLFMILAVCWIIFLFWVIPNKKLPVITKTGAYTMPIYLLHGFLVRIIWKADIMQFGTAGNILLAAVLALCITLCLGNRTYNKLVRFGT